MILEQIAGVSLLKFDNLSKIPGIIHAFSTRLGGVSSHYYSSMNLGFSRGDSEDNVRENFRRFCYVLNIDENALVFGAQTHSVNIKRAVTKDRGAGISKINTSADIDGLATNETGVFLTTFYADCVPLYFVDLAHHAVALSHAGWRGTLKNMAGITVKFMSDEFGSLPENIIVGIGPSICQKCYEVDKNVAEKFEKLSPDLIKDCIKSAENSLSNKKGEFYLNLAGINFNMLCDCGVLPEHIEISEYCTSCNSELLFSHRASSGMRGSLCAVLGFSE